MKKFIPILGYHSLDPKKFPGKLALPPEIFKKQMNILKKRNFCVVGLEECAQGGWYESLWGRKAAITFDDGYLDNYHCAFPVLCELGFAAAFFVTPSLIGQEGFMTWPMLREMVSMPGIEIGSHALQHKPLADIPEKEAWESLVISKKMLEDALGKEIKGVSYPSGSFNEKVVEMAKAAGYRYGCAASHVHDRKWEGHPFLLRRIKISSSSRSELAFRLRLSGFYHFFGRP